MQQMKRYNIVMAEMGDPLALEVAKRLCANPWPSLGVAREQTRAFWTIFKVQLRIENVTASVKRKILS